MNQDIRKRLDDDIPKEAIIMREAYKGGPKLSYLSGAYVKNRLNQVLGQGNWSYNINELTKVHEGTISQYNGEAFTTSYIAQVELRVRADEKGRGFDNLTYFTEVGYGDGTDRKSPGKAHELAVKEAVTDALKRAATNLGLSMGLALYFKEGQYVGEENTDSNQDTKSNEPVATAASTTAPAAASKPKSTATQRKQIKAVFRALKEQEKTTAEEFSKSYLGGIKVDDLTDEAVSATIEKIKTDFPNFL